MASSAQALLSQQRSLTKADVAQRLRDWQAQIKSMSAKIDCQVTTITPENRARFKRALQKLESPKEREQRYQGLLTEKDAREASYTASWWRKGDKEKLHKSKAGQDPKSRLGSIHAFDGNVLRTLSVRSDGSVGSLESRDKNVWLRTIRDEPYSAIFEAGPLKMIELIERSVSYKVEFAGEDTHTVTFFCDFTHEAGPVKGQRSLVFANDGRLLERNEFMGSGPAALTNKTTYLDYKPLPDGANGEIWFPTKLVIHRYGGSADLGELIEFGTETLHCKDLKFNEDIPDSVFTIDFPKDAKIDDRLTGQGWLPPGSSQTLWENPPLPARSVWWKWLIAVVAISVMIGLVLWFRSSRKTPLGGQSNGGPASA